MRLLELKYSEYSCNKCKRSKRILKTEKFTKRRYSIVQIVYEKRINSSEKYLNINNISLSFSVFFNINTVPNVKPFFVPQMAKR